MARKYGQAPSAGLRTGVARLIEQHGLARAAEILGLREQPTSRLALGLPVLVATITVAQLNLDKHRKSARAA